MSAPVERVSIVDLGRVICRSKKEARRIANRIYQYIRRARNRDALAIIVLSTVNTVIERVRVLPSGRKTVDVLPGYTLSNTPWHVHITILSKPGCTFGDEIGDYLARSVPSRCQPNIAYDKNKIGAHTHRRIRYSMCQSVVIRTVAVGNHERLKYRKQFLGWVRDYARMIGYRWLGIVGRIS